MNNTPGQNVDTKKKKNTDIIFNYSSLELTQPMKNLLNRALNFAILPLKLDLTEVLVDYNKFASAVTWHEYWYNQENDEDYEKTNI